MTRAGPRRGAAVPGLAALGRAHPGAARAAGVTPDSGRHPLHLGHHRLTQRRDGDPRRCTAHRLRLRAEPRVSRMAGGSCSRCPATTCSAMSRGCSQCCSWVARSSRGPAFGPADYFAGIQRHRASDILCVPTMTVALLEHPAAPTIDLSSVIGILSGAAPARCGCGSGPDRPGHHRDHHRLRDDRVRRGDDAEPPEDPLDLHSHGRPAKMAGAAGLAEHGGALCGYTSVDPVTGADLPAGARASWSPTARR